MVAGFSLKGTAYRLELVSGLPLPSERIHASSVSPRDFSWWSESRLCRTLTLPLLDAIYRKRYQYKPNNVRTTSFQLMYDLNSEVFFYFFTFRPLVVSL